jgi:hypothetical protein
MTIDHDDHEVRVLYAACSRDAGTLQLWDASEVGDTLCELAARSACPSPAEAQCTIGSTSPSKCPSDGSCFAG